MKFSKYFLLILIISFLKLNGVAQIGGKGIYSFLTLPTSARLAFNNPSLINPQMDNHLGFTFTDHFADISSVFVAYSKTFKKYGSFCAGLQYVNYGSFRRFDFNEVESGTFNAADYALNIGYSKPLDSVFTIGVDLKNIYSVYDVYKSYGLASDVALTYYKAKSQFTASLIVDNIGSQIKYYVPNDKEPLPFNVQLSISKRFKHLPFRLYLNFTHLEKFDLTYTDPSVTTSSTLLTDSIKKTKFQNFEKDAGTFLDKFARHIVIGGELIPVKNFYLRFGYNYERRQELKLDTRTGMVGFSFGLGMRVNRFHISYSRAIYNFAAKTNLFTITTNLNSFVKK